MKDNSKYIAIILVILVVIVLIINLLKNETIEETKKEELAIVKNYSNFYTVNSCLYRTITYASSKESDNLLLLLTDEYVKKNKITKENVLTLFQNVNENSTFVSEKMYYSLLDDSITKYYVKGYIQSNVIYQDEKLNKSSENPVYFIVYLDSFNNIFSIEPYNGEIFEKGDLNGK